MCIRSDNHVGEYAHKKCLDACWCKMEIFFWTLCFQWEKLVQRNKVSWLSDERFLPVNSYNSLIPLEGSPPCGAEPSQERGEFEDNEEQPVHLSPSEEGTFCWHLSCANKRSGVSVGRLAGKTNDNSSLPRLMVSVKFIINALTHCLKTLRDSWAEQSFIDQVLAKELNIPLVTLPEQRQVSITDWLAIGTIRPSTSRLHLWSTLCLPVSSCPTIWRSITFFMSPSSSNYKYWASWSGEEKVPLAPGIGMYHYCGIAFCYHCK